METTSLAMIAELKVQLKAYSKKFNVSKPISNDLRYDLIIDTGKERLRTQVKYLNRLKGKHLELILERKHLKQRSYSSKEIDLILIYCPKIEQILALKPKNFHKQKTAKFHLTNENSPFYYKNFIW